MSAKRITSLQRSSLLHRGKLIATVIYEDGTAETKLVKPRRDKYGRFIITQEDLKKAPTYKTVMEKNDT